MSHVLRALSVAMMVGGTLSMLKADDIIPTDPLLKWWKGNLHTHTLWSDGDDFPEMVAEWYRDHGYHFLALSDHNVLSQGQKWKKLPEIEQRGGAAPYEKYLARFGESWVETRRDENGTLEVRLKPLGEFRALVEERGRFLMIQSEEISAKFQDLPIHMNAANLLEVIPPQEGTSVVNTIEINLRAVEEQSERTGQAMLPHLNHPNFGYGVKPEELAEVVRERFFEIYNGHPMVNQLGDEQHASVEKMWDIANTIRLSKLNSPPLFGLATDDSHHYHRGGMNRSTSGRGWVMVRAKHLSPELLIRAIKAGDFYSSSGVTLRDVRYSTESKVIQLDIEPNGSESFVTQFVGTHRNQKGTDVVGMTFATVEGLQPSYQLKGTELYVRAIVTSSQPHDNPSFENQMKQAWTQPVGWVTEAAMSNPQ